MDIEELREEVLIMLDSVLAAGSSNIEQFRNMAETTDDINKLTWLHRKLSRILDSMRI